MVTGGASLASSARGMSTASARTIRASQPSRSVVRPVGLCARRPLLPSSRSVVPTALRRSGATNASWPSGSRHLGRVGPSRTVRVVAYHARSSRRSRRGYHGRLQLAPDDRTDAAVTIRVNRPCEGDTRVGLLGEGGLLGKWDTSMVNPMRRAKHDPDVWEWVLAVPIGASLVFKIVTVDAGDAVERWSPGNEVRVSVPKGCTGVELDVDWPSGNGNRGAPLTVMQKLIVEKPLMDYRVETGGAWLAYGKVSRERDDKEGRGIDVEDDESRAHGDDADDTDGSGGGAAPADASRAAASATGAAAEAPRQRKEDESEDGDEDDAERMVVDAMDAIDLDSDRSTESDASRCDEGDAALSIDESSDDSDPDDSDPDDAAAASGPSDEDNNATANAGGFVVGSHVNAMMGGKHTELVFNANTAADVGVRVGIIEEDRLVELWHEHGTEPGKGMRVGDVYLGVVAKVISGMQGVLVDVTGKGPPYSLMQKGVDDPALAWCHADAPEEKEQDEDRRTSEDDDELEWRDPNARNGDADAGDPRGKAFRSRGRWSEAWGSYDGVGTSEEEEEEEEEDDDMMDATMTVDEGDAADGAPPRRRSYASGSRSAGGGASWEAAVLEVAETDFDGAPPRRSRRRRASHIRDAHHGWTPFKEHVERKGHDASLSGGNKVVEHWRPGMPVVVQVTRLGAGHKGPRVTARPTLPGRNVVLCPDGEGVYVSRKLVGPARAYVKSVGATVVPDDCALIMRTEAAGVSKEVLQMDITSLADDWERIRGQATAAVAAAGERMRSPMPRRLLDAATVEQVLVRDLFGERIAKLTVDTVKAYEAVVADLRRTGASEEIVRRVQLHTGPEDVFEAMGLGHVLHSAHEERVELNDETLPGAHIVIQQTEALTAVDVNAGRAALINDSDNESVAVRVNVAAAKELALQLRLRDIGGLVMIDFIDMMTRDHRKEVEVAFLEAASRDRAQLTFLPISPLGVMEVARERLQGTSHGGQQVVADIKGMPINGGGGMGGPRRFRGPRPPPWERGSGGRRGRGRGRSRGGRGDYDFNAGGRGFDDRAPRDGYDSISGGYAADPARDDRDGRDDHHVPEEFFSDGDYANGNASSGGGRRGWRSREDTGVAQRWNRESMSRRRTRDGGGRRSGDGGSYHSGSYYSARRSSQRRGKDSSSSSYGRRETRKDRGNSDGYGGGGGPGWRPDFADRRNSGGRYDDGGW